MEPNPTSRRSFLTRAGAAAGALVATFGLPAGALADRGRHRRRIYKLAPEGPHYHCSTSQQSTHSCQACKACQSHAKHKLFASKKAAEDDHHRAHPGCRCGVKRGRKLPHDVWHDLFHPKSGNKHVVVDKRDPRVKRILNS
jgi:hypothetical protein